VCEPSAAVLQSSCSSLWLFGDVRSPSPPQQPPETFVSMFCDPDPAAPESCSPSFINLFPSAPSIETSHVPSYTGFSTLTSSTSLPPTLSAFFKSSSTVLATPFSSTTCPTPLPVQNASPSRSQVLFPTPRNVASSAKQKITTRRTSDACTFPLRARIGNFFRFEQFFLLLRSPVATRFHSPIFKRPPT